MRIAAIVQEWMGGGWAHDNEKEGGRFLNGLARSRRTVGRGTAAKLNGAEVALLQDRAAEFGILPVDVAGQATDMRRTMRSAPVLRILWCVLALGLWCLAGPLRAQGLMVGGNTAGFGFDPITGVLYSEVRSRLGNDFPGTTFVSLPVLSGSLSGFDLIILNRFASPALLPAEQASLVAYVQSGGNILYVGEDADLSNDTFTLPFGIAMTPDPATDIPLAYGTYTNPAHPFLTGPFGAPPRPPSGSNASQIATLGPSAELARWDGGGIAISAFLPDTFAPGAGFGLFVTDVNMITPGRYSGELGTVLSNALALALAAKAIRDSDHDGMSDFLEHAFGTNPAVPDVGERGPKPGVAFVGLEKFASVGFYRRVAAPELVYRVRESPDLSFWEYLDLSQQIVGSPVDMGDGTEFVQVRGTIPLSGPNAASSAFLQVVVAKP